MKYLYLIISKIEDWIIITATLAVLSIIALSAAARYFFSYNLAGAEEILGLAGAWMFFMGAVRASRTHNQIKADIISSFVKNKKIIAFFDILKDFLAVLICGIFSYWSIDFVAWEIESGGHTPALAIPLLVGKISLFLSCFGMMSYSIRDLVKDLKNIKRI